VPEENEHAVHNDGESTDLADNASAIESSGTFALGRFQVRRMGYGAMQLAGDNVFGPPRDRDEALRVLRAAVRSGINHLDTAQYYGPGTVNEVIREALYPYPSDLAIVSKVAARRDEAGAVLAYDEPDQLRAGNRRELGNARRASTGRSEPTSDESTRDRVVASTLNSRLSCGPAMKGSSAGLD